MTGRRLLYDEGGGVTTDWVALTAGILLLGIIVTMSVMENSAGYLMDEFDDLNEQYQDNAVAVSELQDRLAESYGD